MRILYAIILFLFGGHIYAQVENGCISIDFESIPLAIPSEGLVIDNQFEPSFGLTFVLENGTAPRLAEVGSPTTAFGSAYGNDTPAPGVDMGSYFITDDGMLQGLSSSPLILRFETPIDSFAGCIVDIDLQEVFVIEARDENDAVILSETITDGDPGTGDGELTCWGFNLPGCEGAIYSIRFSGSRVTPGSFGLGMDNFSFCYSGLPLDIDPDDATCVENGTIEIINDSNELWEYSLDGVNFSENGIFEDLEPNIYRVFVRNEFACETFVDVVIRPPELSTVTISENPTSCNLENGSVNISVSPENGATYSLDGIEFQEDSLFINLPPADYTLTVVDTNECFYYEDFTIDPSVAPEIVGNQSSPDICGQANGSVEISGSGGNGSLEYSIDGVNYSSDNIIGNMTEGSYTLYVRDEESCVDTFSIDLGGTPIINVLDLISTLPDCFEENGTLEIIASGGTGDLTYSVNGVTFQQDSLIENLNIGLYDVFVEDELGCQAQDTAVVGAPLCPIYIPNVFTPNGNGLEEIFQAFTNPLYDVGIIEYRIYDRWGELVFISGQFSIHTNEKQYWWDGYFNGKPANIGVYTYMIEVIHPNGTVELYANDVTLLR